jgi:hypothetical protein
VAIDSTGGAGGGGLVLVGDPADEPVRQLGAVVTEPHECQSWIGCPCDVDGPGARQ